MPSRKASDISKRFSAKALVLDGTRNRVELAYQAGHLRLADVESSYAGLFLQAVLAYEAAIEDFVLGMMVRPGGVVSGLAGVRSRVKVRSYSHALDLASKPGREYADWIGKDQLLSKAKIFLGEGKPFSSLADGDWIYVIKSKYIRNAIAHPSKAALESFSRRVIGSTPLPARERSVHGYLRGVAVTGGQTRWELHVAGLNVFVSRIAT